MALESGQGGDGDETLMEAFNRRRREIVAKVLANRQDAYKINLGRNRDAAADDVQDAVRHVEEVNEDTE